MHVPRTQQTVQHVPRLGATGHQRVIHAPVIMTVPLAAKLLSMHLYRQTININRHRLLAMALVVQPQPTTRQLRNGLAQYSPVTVRAEQAHQPRKRGL